MSAANLVRFPLLDGGDLYVDPEIIVAIHPGGGRAAGKAILSLTGGMKHILAVSVVEAREILGSAP